MTALVWQGIMVSAVAAILVIGSAWWLFRSPLPAAAGPPAPPSARLAGWVAALLGLSALQMTAGALWDASQHIQTGIVPGGSDFLWPSHIAIYSSFLVALAVALVTLGLLAVPAWRAGQRDPRQWFRQHPYLGAVALASVYELCAIPGDALWHEVFGIDLTAWSPPHLLLGAASAAVLVCAAGLLVQARPAMSRPAWAGAGILALLGLMLNVVYIVGVLEWELPVTPPAAVAARPLWLYPVVGGALAYFALALARRLVAWRWSATAAAAAFYAVRLGITAGLGLTGQVMPYLPLLFIAGAILMDLADQWRTGVTAPGSWMPAVAFTAGYALLALPDLAQRAHLSAWTSTDAWMTVAVMPLVALAAGPLAALAARRLAGRGAAGGAAFGA